jgi:hypothetical protein
LACRPLVTGFLRSATDMAEVLMRKPPFRIDTPNLRP